MMLCTVFFFNETATTDIYTYGHTLSLHDALPICVGLLESRDRTRRLLGAGIIVGGEALDLLAVEDGVALEIGDLALALLPVLVRLGCRQAVGVDDERARLALADEAAQLLRLPEGHPRSEEHTSELQSLMRISYAVFCLKKNKQI